MFAGYDLAYEFTGSARSGGVSTADRTDRAHGSLSNGGLLDPIINVTVAAFGQPFGRNAVQQRRQ
ncbi:MAG: hypothetical protein DMG78_05170 [Acidobacteria bacterium]|nr:MAG: hypothetical protein DMG78_05170 [Acidobacteriota bacterium]